MFGVKPEEYGLGRRDVLGFMLYKHLMKHLVGISVSQRRVKVCEPVLNIVWNFSPFQCSNFS